MSCTLERKMTDETTREKAYKMTNEKTTGSTK